MQRCATSRRLRPTRPTITTPSTLRSNGNASETAVSGGVSITTRSYVDFACSSRLSIAWLSINSPGFGGSAAPATSTSKLRRSTPSPEANPDRSPESPRPSSRRRSAHPPGPVPTGHRAAARSSDAADPPPQQHPRAHPRRRARQMTGDRRLAVARSGRGDQQRAQLRSTLKYRRCARISWKASASLGGKAAPHSSSPSRSATAPGSRGRRRAAATRRSPPGPSAP